jgi:tRNA (guanosine-2'-O-)-methyltransferase
VSAALLLYTLSRRLHNSDIRWQLSCDEKDELLLQWCRNTIKRVEVLEETFSKRFG